MQTITTEVYYRERIMPPPGSSLSLVMEDVAIQDIAATPIAALTIDDIGAPPYQMELAYDPSLIQQRGRYALRAQIRHEGKLLFTSTEHIEAFSPNPAGIVEIRMDKIPARPVTKAAE